MTKATATRRTPPTTTRPPPRSKRKTPEVGPTRGGRREGAGRPRKLMSPLSADKQVELAAAVVVVELERETAAAAYGKSTTVAAEIRLLRAEMSVASAWAAYCRSQGGHGHAIRYAEVETKLAGRIAVLREIEAVDRLKEIHDRSGREDALAKRVAAGR